MTNLTEQPEEGLQGEFSAENIARSRQSAMSLVARGEPRPVEKLELKDYELATETKIATQ